MTSSVITTELSRPGTEPAAEPHRPAGSALTIGYAFEVPMERINTDALKSKTNIVELIGLAVELKKSGKDFMGLCPFHSEKTPSFSVSESKQFYHCFGCGAHGDAISFIMEFRNTDFVDACNRLMKYNGQKA